MTNLGRECSLSSVKGHCKQTLAVTSLFFLSLLLFTWGLATEEVIGFESRFYLFALEMWHYGASWFPTTYQQPYPDYPATATWLIYLVAKLLGHMNKFIAVLPSAIAAAMTVTMTYLIGALRSKRWGLYAVFFLFYTVVFLKTARFIELDMYSAMITATCFYLIYSADLHGKSSPSYWIYFLLVLGFAFRGPIGLVIPAGVISTYYLFDTRFKMFFITGLLSFLLLLISTSLMLMLAYYMGGLTFMHAVLHMQVLGRMDNSFLPFYFYFTDSLASYALSFPLACFVLFGGVYYLLTEKKQSHDIKLLLKLSVWMLIILLGMSIPGDKKTRYILPMLPAAALTAAYLFLAPNHQKYFNFIRCVLLRCFLYAPTVFLLVSTYIFYDHDRFNLPFSMAVILFLITMQLIALMGFYYFKNKKANRECFVLFISTLAFVMTYITVAEPVEVYLDQSRHFVLQIESQRVTKKAALAFYKEKPDGLPIKYLINMKRPEKPIFIESAIELQQFKQFAFIISSISYFDQLPKEIANHFQVIAKNKLGHIPILVFIKKEADEK